MDLVTDEKIVLLGNDLVDLDYERNSQALDNREFRRRVFTDDEELSIDSAEEPLKRLWSIWACKEAAYKALAAYYPDIIFAWKKYRTNRDLSNVTYGKHEVYVNVQELDERGLLAIAIATAEDAEARPAPMDDTQNEIFVWSSRVEKPPGVEDVLNESRLIRVWAVQQIADMIGIDPGRLTIASRDPDNAEELVGCAVTEQSPQVQERAFPASVPVLLIDDQMIPHRLSLSRDGRFVSAALYLNPELIPG